MITMVISGGQSGADMGGLIGATAAGVSTGGFAAPGYMTEYGPKPNILQSYGLVDVVSDPRTYRIRAEKNVLNSHGTVLFGNVRSPGSRLAIKYCNQYRRPYITNPNAFKLAEWIKQYNVGVLNVAGNRESKKPGLQDKVAVVVEMAIRIVNGISDGAGVV